MKEEYDFVDRIDPTYHQRSSSKRHSPETPAEKARNELINLLNSLQGGPLNQYQMAEAILSDTIDGKSIKKGDIEMIIEKIGVVIDKKAIDRLPEEVEEAIRKRYSEKIKGY